MKRLNELPDLALGIVLMVALIGATIMFVLSLYIVFVGFTNLI